MQYTGLKDEKGKEIYEGDILITAIFPEGDIRVQTVVSDDDCPGSLCFKPKTGASLVKSNQYLFEVIGNIYENPELLD